jgi:hypothetical protein
MVTVHIGNNKYNLDTNDSRQALHIIKEYCEERGYNWSSPLVINGTTQHVSIVDKSGKHVTTCKIYDKR